MTTDLLSDLNPQQREAAEAVDGPVLVIAGPGSGKTRVITRRIGFLVRACKVSPFSIAAVTFTNKAAREMRERLEPLLGQRAEDLTCGTFHWFCARILRREGERIGLDRNFSIYDGDDQVSAIKGIMKDQKIDPRTFNPRAIQSIISSAKSRLLTAQGFRYHTESYTDEVALRVYEAYEDVLAQSSALDFDDLLLRTFTLLKDLPDVARSYQDRYVHLLVDEFQDTNIAQYNIAKQIGETNRNICAVGDPDQSIYSWRNADIRNILSFQKDFPETRVITLDENYRSSQTILDAATGLISSNQSRLEKDLWTRNGVGVPIVVYEGYDDTEEAGFAVKEVAALLRQGNYNPRDIAVMYRVNAQSRALEEACLREGLPYQIIGGQRFYNRQEIRDLIGYLRLIANPNDNAGLQRVINVPQRSIGQRTVDEVVRVARDGSVSMMLAIDAILAGDAGRLAARSVKALRRFRELIDTLVEGAQHLDITGVIDLVMDRTGYGIYLEELERGEDRLENVLAFRDAAAEYLHLGMQDALMEFLERVSLVSDVDSYEDKADLITLITLHQAKGLEFPVVFIAGMEEGLLPHIRSLDDEDELEEERRLCYVGVTRARDRLYLLRAFRRGFRGGFERRVPSRFLAEIPQKLLVPAESAAPKVRRKKPDTIPSPEESRVGSENAAPEPSFTTGDKVLHAKFGEGIVVNSRPSDGDVELTVAFDGSAGIKRLLASFAPLQRAGHS